VRPAALSADPTPGMAADHGSGADHHGHFSLAELALPYFHIIIDSLNIIGVCIMFVSVLAVLPTVITQVLPSMFAYAHEDARHMQGHRHGLHVRITLSRGIMLGLDFMVGADVIETLAGCVERRQRLQMPAIACTRHGW